MNDLERLAERWEAVAANADPNLGTPGALIANTWRLAAKDLRAALRAEARPPEGLDTEQLARAMRFGVAWESVPHPDEWLGVAEKVAAEYARLSAGGATKP